MDIITEIAELWWRAGSFLRASYRNDGQLSFLLLLPAISISSARNFTVTEYFCLLYSLKLRCHQCRWIFLLLRQESDIYIKQLVQAEGQKPHLLRVTLVIWWQMLLSPDAWQRWRVLRPADPSPGAHCLVYRAMGRMDWYSHLQTMTWIT